MSDRASAKLSVLQLASSPWRRHPCTAALPTANPFCISAFVWRRRARNGPFRLPPPAPAPGQTTTRMRTARSRSRSSARPRAAPRRSALVVPPRHLHQRVPSTSCQLHEQIGCIGRVHLRAAARPRHTSSTSRPSGASVSKTTMRPNPTREARRDGPEVHVSSDCIGSGGRCRRRRRRGPARAAAAPPAL